MLCSLHSGCTSLLRNTLSTLMTRSLQKLAIPSTASHLAVSIRICGTASHLPFWGCDHRCIPSSTVSIFQSAASFCSSFIIHCATAPFGSFRNALIRPRANSPVPISPWSSLPPSSLPSLASSPSVCSIFAHERSRYRCVSPLLSN